MSRLIVALLLSVVINLTAATSFISNDLYVLTRFYPKFAQVYRAATPKSYLTDPNGFQLLENYEFLFDEKQYWLISETSLAMLDTDVIDRTIVHHPHPNFETNGTRYLYYRDPTKNESIEIELVNPKDRLFREVQRPTHYLYLSSNENLVFLEQEPKTAYYEVLFTCQSMFPINMQAHIRIFTYIDKSIQWTPRYILDLTSLDSGNQPIIYAYADIRNSGEQSVMFREAEFVAGDTHLNEHQVPQLRSGFAQSRSLVFSSYLSSGDDDQVSSLGELANGVHVYRLSPPSPIALLPRSLKSIEFFKTNVTVESFVSYSSAFSPANSNGKLLNAYNITSSNAFIPSGALTIHKNERFLGRIQLPDLSKGETYTVKLGDDSDVSYHRLVQVLDYVSGRNSITYLVEYYFENYKTSRPVRLHFRESFKSLKNYRITNISTFSYNNINTPDLILYGTDLVGVINISPKRVPKVISYQLVTEYTPHYVLYEK